MKHVDQTVTTIKRLPNNSQASFVVLCWMQVCSTSLARSWTSARTQRCISNTSRPHARRAKSKKWSGSVGKATAMTLNMSRTFSRYCQDSWKWSIADRKKHIIFSSFSSVKTLSFCFPHYISCLFSSTDLSFSIYMQAFCNFRCKNFFWRSFSFYDKGIFWV